MTDAIRIPAIPSTAFLSALVERIAGPVAAANAIERRAPIAELGLDDLSLIELQSELAQAMRATVLPVATKPSATVFDLVSSLISHSGRPQARL